MRLTNHLNFVAILFFCLLAFSCKLKEGDEVVSRKRFYGKGISTIVLPSTIKRIEESAFENNNLTEIFFPQSLTFIGPHAFANNSLQKLTIPEGVTEISDYAFSNNQISEIILPKTLQKIGGNAFVNNNIQTITIPEGVTAISDYAFSNNQISEIILPQTLQKIGGNAFANNNIQTITIPEGVKEIGSYAFARNKLTVVLFEAGKINLGEETFAYNQIQEINLKHGISFAWNTFSNNNLSKFTLPEGFINIGGAPNNKITTITIPSSANTIIDHAFENNQITMLKIPANLKTIGAYSFKGNKITSLYIPKNVESIGEYAFADNPLERVTIENKAVKIGTNNFSQKIMNSIVKQTAVSVGYDDLAREMNKWKWKTVRISGKISQIEDNESTRPKIYLDLSGDGDWSLEWDYKKVYITYRYGDDEKRFLENDRIIVWGTVDGTTEHRSKLDVLGLGTASKLPTISAQVIERQQTKTVGDTIKNIWGNL